MSCWRSRPTKPKCVRCWHYRADVGTDAAHPRVVRALRRQHRRAGRRPEMVLMLPLLPMRRGTCRNPRYAHAPMDIPNPTPCLADPLGRRHRCSTMVQGLGAGARCPNTPPVPVIDGFWNWYRTYNTGAAFSFLSDAGGWQKWFFIVLAVGDQRPAGVLAVAHAAPRLAHGAAVTRWSSAARIGNVIDRCMHGHVVDFIQWHWRRPLLAGVQRRRLGDRGRRGRHRAVRPAVRQARSANASGEAE